tara:strand:- start:934 stop:1083 length:150 start_codon:yes stop_codon:yes gene_type:complete
MKKLILLLLIIPLISFGQEDIKQGLVTEHYESGIIKEIKNYKNGALIED